MIPQMCSRNPWNPVARAFALAIVFSLTLLSTKAWAATDWSSIQTALQANGTAMPGNVLRFELVRQDLHMMVNGQPVPSYQTAAVANGFVAFRPMHNGWFFVDGSLPAEEGEVAGLESALAMNDSIHITAIAGRSILESPKLIWVHFEARGNGAAIAGTLATALATIHNPQMNVTVIPGTNSVFNPASILPPKYLTLFKEGFVEQLTDIFAFYLPRPDEHWIRLGGEPAETGLGVGQSFYIQVPFSGGTDVTLNVDLALRADEVAAVEKTLRAGGFTISSQTNNFMDERPDLYFVHASGSGDGFTLGNALYSAIQSIQADSTAGHDHDGGFGHHDGDE